MGAKNSHKKILIAMLGVTILFYQLHGMDYLALKWTAAKQQLPTQERFKQKSYNFFSTISKSPLFLAAAGGGVLALILLGFYKKGFFDSEIPIVATEQKALHAQNGVEQKQEIAKEEIEDALIAYIKEPLIPEKVKKFAMIGVENYKKQDSALKKARGTASQPKPAGGRTTGWIRQTFGQNELSIENSLKPLAAPQTWTLQELDDAYVKVCKQQLLPTSPSLSSVEFTLVKGLSVTYLNELSLGQNCIVQLASQFNYLEAPGPKIVPVESYVSDGTQGPQGAIEAAAAAIHRTAAVKANKLAHALINVLPSDHTSYYKNGYLTLENYEGNMDGLANHIETNLARLRILPQWVICEASGAHQLQLFSAAPSFQGSNTGPFNSSQGGDAPTFDSPQGKICNTLVSAQYEAIGKIAVIWSLQFPQKRVNVHLTLAGQGVFRNPPEIMNDAFKKIAQIITGYNNIHVYIHGYTEKSQESIKSVCKQIQIKCNEMTIAEFVKSS